MTQDAPILSRQCHGVLELVKYVPTLSLLKQWGELAKVNKNIAMHSLRRGSATLMSLAGFQLEDIKDRGDWQSTVVLKYLSYPLSRKIHIDKEMVNFINQIL